MTERFDGLTQRAGRDLDDSRAAVSVMKAASRLSQAIERALSDADLTLPQFNVLMELAAAPDGALPMHTVIDRLISSPPSVSWLTSRMGERGLITKQRAEADARVVLLAIAEPGWEALEQAVPLVSAAERVLWQQHGRADLRTIAALLEPLVRPERLDGDSSSRAPDEPRVPSPSEEQG